MPERSRRRPGQPGDLLEVEGAEADEVPDEAALLRTLDGADEGRHCETNDPFLDRYGFADDDEAVDRLARYKRLMATPPDRVDISDLDPDDMDEWTDDQWLRADHSGFLDRIGFYEEDGEDEEAGEETAESASNKST